MTTFDDIVAGCRPQPGPARYGSDAVLAQGVAAPTAEPADPPDDRKGALTGVALIDATPHQCRWPLWQADTDPRHVCGVRSRPGSPYCREHHARAFERKPTLRRKL